MPVVVVVVVPAVVVLSKASVSDMAGLQGVDAGAGGGDMHGTGIMVATELEESTGGSDEDGCGIIISELNHGCDKICSKVGRSDGRYSRQRRMRSSHCGERRTRPGVLVTKWTVARTI